MILVWIGLQAAGVGVMTWLGKREARQARSKSLLLGHYKSLPMPFVDSWVRRNLRPKSVSKIERWQADRLVSIARWAVHRKVFEDLVLFALTRKQKPGIKQNSLVKRFIQ